MPGDVGGPARPADKSCNPDLQNRSLSSIHRAPLCSAIANLYPSISPHNPILFIRAWNG
jgi:hypothetical protein